MAWEMGLFGPVVVVQDIKDDMSSPAPSLLYEQLRLPPLRNDVLLLDQILRNPDSLFGGLANLSPVATL